MENNKETGKKEENYFQRAKLYLLNNPKELLDLLMNYDKEKIDPKQVAKIDKFCAPNPKFNRNDAFGGSKATGFLFGW